MFREERMDRRWCRAYLHAILTMNAAFPGGYDSERVARFFAFLALKYRGKVCDRFEVFHICRYTNGRNTLRRKREILRGICHGCWECLYVLYGKV